MNIDLDRLFTGNRVFESHREADKVKGKLREAFVRSLNRDRLRSDVCANKVSYRLIGVIASGRNYR